MTNDHRYTDAEITAVERVIRERRDMRHFLPDPLTDGLLERLVEAAHLAPSVGFMQPWRFLRITDGTLRGRLHEGILDCAEVLVVALMPERERHIVGRRCLPEMDVASVGCAIQNMWLLARAEGVGLGWVSFFEPEALAQLLGMPQGAHPVAILCIGRVPAFYPRPMFEDSGWGKRLSLEDVLFENRWKVGAGGTAPAY